MDIAKQKQWDEAIAKYTKTIELDPKLAVPYGNRAYAYYNKGDYDKAIADCTKATLHNG